MTYTEWQRRDNIREVQEYLRTLVLVDNNHRELAVDGIFGEETEDAVKQFQLANGLPVTGRVDSETWDRLLQDYLDALTLLSDAVALKVFPAPQYTLKESDTGNTVFILQAMLNTLTDTVQGLSALNVNGVFDSDTAQRVKELQRIGGFSQTGEVDRSFWDHLASWYNSL